MSEADAMEMGLLGRVKAFAGQHKTSVRVGGIGIVMVGLVAFLMGHTARQAPPKPPPVITMVMVHPQKPPPPPPPLPTPKMITPPKMATPVVKPMITATPTKAPPKSAAPAPMSTSIHSSGPADAFNLAGSGNGMGILGGDGGGGGSVWGYYSSQVQIQVQQALQRNAVTRHASAGLQARIWVDGTGRVTRVSLDKSSGNAQVDDAVENQVLANMQMAPPPAGMPMPIVMSLTGEAPL